jgi:F-type H+-transporting ATPase subunit a
MAVDPIHQFEIRELFPIAKIGNTEIAFTNSAAYMFVAVAVIVAFLIGGTTRRSLVPGRDAQGDSTGCHARCPDGRPQESCL